MTLPSPKPSSQTLDLNPHFKRALDLLENSQKNVFITGKAGTGKSTLLTYFRETTLKKIAVLAPTGIAAINVKGQTIHSFFKFKPNVTLESIQRLGKEAHEKKSLYQKLDALVVDEISMVRADLMDCMDKFLRLNGRDSKRPFGGVQMIFIGDLYQLPPVVSRAEKEIFNSHYKTPYFFSGHFFENFEMELVELDQVYRQKDQKFIYLLNAIRTNSIREEELKVLNQRVNLPFTPSKEDFYIYLAPTNQSVESLNEAHLAQLSGPLYHFEGRLSGDYEKSHLPTLMDLNLKVGAQVMMVNNDSSRRWVNGTLGKVKGIEEEEEGDTFIIVQLETGSEVAVTPYQWDLYEYSLKNQAIQAETIGTFTQYPMKLAWAITIHKSQGKTFNKAIIDLGQNVFTSGQTYVALSRCTSLEGMILKNLIEKKHIWTDDHIVKFMTMQRQFSCQPTKEVSNG